MRDDNADRLAFACVAGATLLYLAADLASRTMGLDGVVYAGIARHLSEGLGSFWFPPHFDASALAFHDHPPLGVWLQSQWFALFGSAFWVERLYCVALLLVLLLLVAKVYRSAGGTGAWWPLLFLLPIPVVTRAIKDNLLETLVAIVALAAVWMAWQGRNRGGWHRCWDVGVGFLCLAGALTKGPAAVFPLVAPGVVALVVDRSLSQALIRSLTAGFAFLLPFVLLLTYPPVLESLSRYLDVQLLASLVGERPADHDRIYLLGQMAVQLGVLLLVLLAAMAFNPGRIRFSRESLTLFVIGLAGMLPLLISPRQYRHYLMPAMPLFALAASLLITPPALTRARRLLPWLAAVLVVAVLARGIWWFGAPGKDRDLLADAAKIASVAELRGAESVSFCQTADQLRLYLWRYHSIRSSRQQTPGLHVCATAEGAEKTAELSEARVLWWREEA